MNNKLVNHTSDQMKTKQYLFSLGLIGALAFGGGQASAQYVPFDDAQGPQSIFVNASTKQSLEQNASTLRDYLQHRRSALLQWNSLDPAELQPVTLRVQAVAKNRGGMRELRVRRFHYIGDCALSHGGQDSGVDTPTTAQAVFASDIADSYLNEAALLGIPIDSLSIEIHGRPDEQPTGRVYYPRNYLYTVYIDTPASDAELQLLSQRAEANSPIVQFIKQAIPLSHSIEVPPSPKTKKVQGATLAGLREYIQGKRQATLAAQKAREQAAKQGKTAQQPTVKEGPWVRVLNNGVRELTVNGKYRILHDNPAYLGGYNTGMTARENLLGVLATCITHITEGQAALLNVTLDSLALEVPGKWDPRGGRPGFEQVPQYPTDIHYTLHVKTPESEARIEELLAAVEKICPMYNLFIDAPQTFEAKIVRVGRK